jgi:hypothetical protein
VPNVPTSFDEQLPSTIRGGVLGGGVGNTMGSRVIGEKHTRRETQGTITVARPGIRPATHEESPEQIKRDREDAKRQSEFAKLQQKVAVPLSQIADAPDDLTLWAALDRIEAHGGAVLAAEHGVLRFLLPERLHENALTDRSIRRTLLDAVRVLDNSRGLVHALLKAKKALPDLPPAAGGGVAA